MHRIETIEAGTPAEKSGIAVGDYLIAINGHQIKDVLDYMVFSTEEELRLDMCSAKGKSYTVLLQNLQGKPLGMGLPAPHWMKRKNARINVFLLHDQRRATCARRYILKTMIIACVFYTATM